MSYAGQDQWHAAMQGAKTQEDREAEEEERKKEEEKRKQDDNDSADAVEKEIKSYLKKGTTAGILYIGAGGDKLFAQLEVELDGKTKRFKSSNFVTRTEAANDLMRKVQADSSFN